MIKGHPILERLAFREENGLCYTITNAENNAERLYMHDAAQLGVDAVYFRRFYRKDNDEKSYHSEPAVCILKRGESFFNSEKHHQLHAALWSAGRIEIYIIYSATRIDIINARRPAKRVVGKDKLEISVNDKELTLVSEAIEAFDNRRFAAHLFDSGTFWEQPDFKDRIDGNSSPYHFLLSFLDKARKQLISQGFLDDDATLDKLLIVSILVKFLEDSRDENGSTLEKIYQKYDIESFIDGITKGEYISILDDLSNEFNGKVFDTFSDKERRKVQDTDLTPIAHFLKADIDLDTRQGFLWEQYDFRHLPPEVISGIYENFIQAASLRQQEKKEKGIVYTPLHLVNLLIDEVMPLDQPELFKDNSFKVLDPACGSGIFLVAAYKRLLQWWTINNNQDKDATTINYPNKKVAQDILEDNIFGVDMEETAVLVSIFGLTIALLERLNPKEIWNNLKFKNLKEKNIKGANFIEWANANKESKLEFDLVVGNPPFNPSSKGGISNNEFETLFDTKVPAGKLALKFLEGAFFFGNKVGMVIPSNVLLYNKASTNQRYRNKLFTDRTVKKIYDFTHLRRDLFHKTADTPVVALIAENKTSEYQSIEHIVVKREVFSEKKMRFEIDYYDYHQVRWDWATNPKMQFIWKTNLLGGGRLFNLIYRLSLLRTLKEFIKEKQKENPEWLYSSGYKIGGKSRDRNFYEFIHDKPTISTSKKFDYINNRFFVESEQAMEFEAPRTKKLYTPPLLIAAEIIKNGKIPMQLFSSYQVFNISFIGIKAPKTETAILEQLYDDLFVSDNRRNAYQAYILSTSSKILINKETAFIKEDFDNLPYPSNRDYLNLSKEEQITCSDLVNYYLHLGKSIGTNGKGLILHEPITEPELQAFGKTYCDTLNEIYAKNGKSWQVGKVIQTPVFVQYQFGFGNDDGLEYDFNLKTDNYELLLLEDVKSNKGAIHKRIIRQYKHENGYDCVIFTKPQARRYWLKSIALHDADDTFSDLRKEGY